MKKIIGILILLFVIVSCSQTEVSTEYRELSHQFDQFVIRDYHQTDGFIQLTNKLTTEYTPSSIRVSIRILAANASVIEERVGSAFIIDSDETHYYALTTSDHFFKEDAQLMIIGVYDYQGAYYPSRLKHIHEAGGLALLAFEKGPNTLVSATLSQTVPFPKEPIFLMGNPFQTQNLILGGLYLGMVNHQGETTIPSDHFGNGSALFNIELHVIGIQVGLFDAKALFIPSSAILAWLETLDVR